MAKGVGKDSKVRWMVRGVSSGKKAVVEDWYQSSGMRSQAVRGLAWCHPGVKIG